MYLEREASSLGFVASQRRRRSVGVTHGRRHAKTCADCEACTLSLESALDYVSLHLRVQRHTHVLRAECHMRLNHPSIDQRNSCINSSKASMDAFRSIRAPGHRVVCPLSSKTHDSQRDRIMQTPGSICRSPKHASPAQQPLVQNKPVRSHYPLLPTVTCSLHPTNQTLLNLLLHVSRRNTPTLALYAQNRHSSSRHRHCDGSILGILKRGAAAYSHRPRIRPFRDAQLLRDGHRGHHRRGPCHRILSPR